jgi:sec-independent protein translocase protein TatC
MIKPIPPDSVSDKAAEDAELLRQPLIAHLLELRARLIACLGAVVLAFCGSYYFSKEIYAFLVAPLAAQMAGGEGRLIYTGLAEAFLTYLKLSLWSACCITSPVILVQIWRFIAPGLYQSEKASFRLFLCATPVLFCAGAALAYYLVIPLAWHFFLSFETPASITGLPIKLEARVSEYLSLTMTLIFAFGFAFQLPVLLALLLRIGILTVEQLIQFRRIAIVIIFIVAAIITPPDVMSQLLLAIPLVLLYEISILWGRLQLRTLTRR